MAKLSLSAQLAADIIAEIRSTKEMRITPDMTRDEVLDAWRAQRREIAQYFDDAARWNASRGAIEGAIDPDPDGELRRLADAIDEMLQRELRQ